MFCNQRAFYPIMRMFRRLPDDGVSFNSTQCCISSDSSASRREPDRSLTSQFHVFDPVHGQTAKPALRERRSKQRSTLVPSATHKIPWTSNEIEQLCRGIEQFGTGRWSAISKSLGTRTPLQVKNYVSHHRERLSTLLRERGYCQPGVAVGLHQSEEQGEQEHQKRYLRTASNVSSGTFSSSSSSSLSSSSSSFFSSDGPRSLASDAPALDVMGVCIPDRRFWSNITAPPAATPCVTTVRSMRPRSNAIDGCPAWVDEPTFQLEAMRYSRPFLQLDILSLCSDLSAHVNAYL
eukprot:ANDGO_02565.mRNA.1 hypothetical protein